MQEEPSVVKSDPVTRMKKQACTRGNETGRRTAFLPMSLESNGSDGYVLLPHYSWGFLARFVVSGASTKHDSCGRLGSLYLADHARVFSTLRTVFGRATHNIEFANTFVIIRVTVYDLS